MATRRPKNDAEEEPVMLGTGYVGQLTDDPPARRKKRNPIGFVWPTTKKPTRKKKS
jgi:hypothetical protein